MTELAQCRACTRHIRVHESRCPFCGVTATTIAPRWIALVGIAPLLFVACSSDAGKADGAAPAKTEPAPPPAAKEPEPKPPEPAPTTAVDPDAKWGEQSMPPDDDAKVLPPPPPEPDPEVDRPMATKYGGPPRPAPKYGLAPRPARKYGAPPKPTGEGGDPLEGL